MNPVVAVDELTSVAADGSTAALAGAAAPPATETVIAYAMLDDIHSTTIHGNAHRTPRTMISTGRCFDCIARPLHCRATSTVGAVAASGHRQSCHHSKDRQNGQ